jgi:hypothetical protein
LTCNCESSSALAAYVPASKSKAVPRADGRDDRAARRRTQWEGGVPRDREVAVRLLQVLGPHDLAHDAVRRGE